MDSGWSLASVIHCCSAMLKGAQQQENSHQTESKKMALSPEQIAEFLNKLDTDDDFRDKLINDSPSVFVEYGISYDPAKIPLPEDVELPAKGAIAENYDAYKDAIFQDNEFMRHAHKLKLSYPAS